MRVSISVNITLKDRPKDFRGMYRESIVIGKDEPVTLDEMLGGLLIRLAPYYGACATPEELNEALDRLAEYFREVGFGRPEEEESHG